MNKTPGWSTTAPTEPGNYWLYGDPTFGSMGVHYTDRGVPEKRLHYVTVIQISNGLLAATNGHYMSLTPFRRERNREGWVGVWQKVVLPELPKKERK